MIQKISKPIQVDLNGLPQHEAGVAFAVILAYQKDYSCLTEFKALMQKAVEALAEEKDKYCSLELKPFYMYPVLSNGQQIVSRLHNALNTRLRAAHIAIHFLKEKVGFTPAAILGRKDVTKLKLNNVYARIADYDDKIDPEKLGEQVYRTSKPVLHLAVALALSIDAAQKRGERTSLGDLIFNPEVLGDVLALAPKCEELLDGTSLNWRSDQIVQLAP